MVKSTRGYESARRDAVRERTRHRIIAAAEAVLERDGWAKFSLEAVAAEAGVTRLTVYHHFGARRALLEAMFDHRAQTDGFADIPGAMTDPDPHAALRRVVAIFCRFWSAGHNPLRGVMAEAMADPEFAEAMIARNERRRTLLDRLVGRLIERGDVDPKRHESLVDTLFALTAFQFHADLMAGRHGKAEVEDILQGLIRSAVTMAAPDRP